MTDKTTFNRETSEHVLEIRFKANSRVLDHRGEWAERISAHLNLDQWRIVENRVDVFDREEKLRAFVGFRNVGMVVKDAPTANYFPDHTAKFLKFLFGIDEFGKELFVERLGVRARFCTSFDGSFDDLKRRFAERYFRLTENALGAIGMDAKVVDVGAMMNFADQHGNFNTMTGPMAEDQIREFFGNRDRLPPVGFYYDIDYWQKPGKVVAGAELVSTVATLSKGGWERHERIRSLVLG